VEDERTVREHLGEVLSDEFLIDMAENGAHALQQVLRARPDIVVTDVMMPDLDGIELLKTLRDTPSTSLIPVLLISGAAPEDMRIVGFEHGADGYLPKPYTERELRARIRALVQGARERERVDLLESITDAFYALDREWRFTYANQLALDYFGTSREELLGKVIWDLIPVSRGTEFERQYRRAARERMSVAFEVFSPFSKRWIDVHVYPTARGLAVNFRDISERKQVEHALRESEERYRYAFDAAAVCLWEEDFTAVADYVAELKAGGVKNIREYFNTHPDQVVEASRRIRVRDVNLATLRIFGVDSKAAFMESLDKAITPRAFDVFRELLIALSEGRSAFSAEAELLTRSSETRHFQVTVNFPPVREALDRVLLTLVDITDRDRAEALKRHYEAILTNTPDLAYVFDLNHRFIYANEGLLRMWGKRWDEAIGKNFLELGYEPWHAEMHDREIDQVIATRRSVRGEAPFNGTFGRRMYDYLFVPVLDAHGEVEAVAGTTRDVTDLKVQDRRKDEFLATLAHELRNPLAPMRNAAQLLKMPGIGEAQARTARQIIERQVQHMVRLIDDLMDVSRITLGQINLRLEKVNLGAVITDALEAARPAIESGGHSLDVHLPPTPLVVEGDGTRLSQVFQNLLNNAAKYTPAGGQITLRAARHGREAFISVRDSGVGIAKEVQERIFDLFTRLDPSESIKVSGLGIGLALAKQLVELHQGRIDVQSEGSGRGSEFTVVLPLVEQDNLQVSGAGGDGSEDIPTEERRVLVVDDNHDSAESLALLLQASGCQVSVAFSGPEALSLFESNRPEIILLDIGMPGMDGYEVARRVRASPAGHQVFLVALTGWGQAEDKQRAAAAGFDEHITKPVDPDRLTGLLHIDR
jgi:PAS domain S-box-containing protein